MKSLRLVSSMIAGLSFGLALGLAGAAAQAADYPAPKQGDWIAKNFALHTGETLPEATFHYTTIGAPTGEPVLVLHGTGGSGAGFLNADFAGQLFGPGQPLDAAKYYIILPDALGAGKSTKPSDGLRAKFPAYNYDDMVAGQFRLVSEGLGVKHLRLVIGNSMGGMQTWLWGVRHPEFMDALVPMASQPTEMAGRNWIMRRMLTRSIRNDPDWNKGDYAKQPAGLKFMNVFFGFATSGGSQGYYQQAPTREAADKMVEARLATPLPADANDFLYQWESSRDYDASKDLSRIQAPLLAINSADDERNPPELGIMGRELKRLKNARLFLIKAGPETRGHGTTGVAKFWSAELARFLKSAPHRGL